MRAAAVRSFDEVIGHVNAIRVVILAEPETGSRGQPRDILRARATLDIISARHEFRLRHVHRDFDVLVFTCFSGGHIFKLYIQSLLQIKFSYGVLGFWGFGEMLILQYVFLV